MKKLWKTLSGNKTIICTTVFGFISRFGTDVGMSDKLIEMVLFVAGSLGLASFGHHVSKGKLTSKVN